MQTPNLRLLFAREPMNCFFEKIIESTDPEANLFLRNLDAAICLTDDLIDHKVNSVRAMDILLHLNVVTELALKRPGLFDSVRKNYDTLLSAEIADMDFVPLKRSNEEELMIWVKRGYRASIAFDVLCFLDKTYDTEENWSWVIESQAIGLILNDCSDILNGEFEDFFQTRRNYVALQCFKQDIYFNWKNEKQKLIEAAAKISTTIELPKPKDERLMSVYEELRGKNGLLFVESDKSNNNS
jgi:hypothetical protein